MSKKKVFLKDGFNIYSAETGRKIDVVELPKDAVLIVYTKQSYHQRRQKKSGGKYVYKLRGGKEWLIANELTTSFLKEVVFDYFETSAVAIDAKRLALVFFGDTQEYKTFPVEEVSDDRLEEEKENFYEGIFQGVPYKVVPIEEVLKLVETKPIWLYFLPLGALAVLGAVGYMLLGGGEEELPPPTKPMTVVKPRKQTIFETDLKIARTRKVLEALKEVQENLKPWWYIEQIDFGGGTIRIRSMLPDEGFKKMGKSWYEGVVRIPLRIKKIPKIDYSNWNECLTFFLKEGADIRVNMPDIVKLRLSKRKADWKKVSEILTEIGNCPAYTTGTVRSNYPPNGADIELEITLYKKRGQK